MTQRSHLLVMPLPPFLGVNVYDGQRIQTKDGYRQERRSFAELDWSWYVEVVTGQCFRAVRLQRPLRVVAAPPDAAGAAAHDLEAGCYLVHGLREIFTVEPEEFGTEFRAVERG